MSGIIGGLFASLKSGFVNLVSNDSFTDISLTGWSGDSVTRTTSTGTPNYFKTAPAGLTIDNPDTDANANYTKAGVLTIGQAYSLSFWLGGRGNVQSSVITLYAGTASKTLTIPSRNDLGWTYQKIENVVCTGNTTLSIQFNSPYNFQLDDIWVVAGTTAYNPVT